MGMTTVWRGVVKETRRFPAAVSNPSPSTQRQVPTPRRVGHAEPSDGRTVADAAALASSSARRAYLLCTMSKVGVLGAAAFAFCCWWCAAGGSNCMQQICQGARIRNGKPLLKAARRIPSAISVAATPARAAMWALTGCCAARAVCTLVGWPPPRPSAARSPAMTS